MENLKFFNNMYDKKITIAPYIFIIRFLVKGFPGNYSFNLKKSYHQIIINIIINLG